MYSGHVYGPNGINYYYKYTWGGGGDFHYCKTTRSRRLWFGVDHRLARRRRHAVHNVIYTVV